MPLIQAVIKAEITAWRLNSSGATPEVAADLFDQGLTDIVVNAISSANATILAGTVSTGASPTVIPLPTNLLLMIS